MIPLAIYDLLEAPTLNLGHEFFFIVLEGPFRAVHFVHVLTGRVECTVNLHIPIRMSMTAAKGEASDFGSKHFYVILGSFSIYDNAQRFKKQLMSEDFYPGILVNQNGLYRVSVNSYDDETQARNRIREIREKFPQYSDVWLLIKKQ